MPLSYLCPLSCLFKTPFLIKSSVSADPSIAMELRRSTFFCLAALCLSLATSVSSVNILVIDGVVSPSHQIWMRELSFALGNHGYNVTVLSATTAKSPPKNVHYLGMPELWEWMHADMDIEFIEMGSMNPFVKIAAFLPMYSEQDQVVLNTAAFTTLTNYPKDFKFDLMIYDYLSAYALVSLKEVFNNPPLVAVSPYPDIAITNLLTRGPDYFSFVPHMLKDEVEDSFWGRLENFLITSIYHALEELYLLPGATKAVRKVLPAQVQTIHEMLLSSKIQMANYHPVIDQVQPILPSVIPVGGLQIAEPKPLPKELEEIYSKAKQGNIIFSLGTNVKSEDLGMERLQGIIGALKEFPEYNFIWKIDLKDLNLEIPKNVYIMKWLPQNDLLADNRTVLFMSHAGGLSTQESTWFGVPMLALPVMFDQFPVCQDDRKKWSCYK